MRSSCYPHRPDSVIGDDGPATPEVTGQGTPDANNAFTRLLISYDLAATGNEARESETRTAVPVAVVVSSKASGVVVIPAGPATEQEKGKS
jgi:hypothetical protein